jgi:hypothetical protein
LAELSVLPELAAIQADPSRRDAVDSLQRAADIFGNFAPGGPSHTAVLAWQCEVHTSRGQYQEALATLDLLQPYTTTAASELGWDLGLARAKTLWMQGDFAGSVAESAQVHTEATAVPLYAVAAQQAMFLGRLLDDDGDDANTEEEGYDDDTDPAVVASLPPLVRVAMTLNQGVAQALSSTAPLDQATQTWQTGLDLLADAPQEEGLVHALEGRLQSNLAWAVLQTPPDDADDDETINAASVYARDALQSLEHSSIHQREGLTRALTLVAQCYHRAHQAVTAQGLLQSALDQPAVSPAQWVERRAAYEAYATLCQEWEHRQSDVRQLQAQSTRITQEELSPGWRAKSPLHASLWFWTPGLFQAK